MTLINWLKNLKNWRFDQSGKRARSPRLRKATGCQESIFQFEELEIRVMMSVAQPTAIRDVGAAAVSRSTDAGFQVDQIRTAYGINALTPFPGAAADGTGQTIAIVDAYNAPTVYRDLDIFDSAMYSTSAHSQTLYSQYGPASSFLKVYNQRGVDISSSIASSGVGSVPVEDPKREWEGEIALDVQWAHAIAPGAKIVLIEADNSSTLYAAETMAALIPSVSVVSNSWGTGGGSEPDQRGLDSIFTTPSGHQGITFLASSGDDGSPGGYPAYSPNVVAVGGTSLQLNDDNTIKREVTWSTSGPYSNNSSGNHRGTGGGVSKYEPEPAYQSKVQNTGHRGMPDVAWLADSHTGVAVADSYSNGNSSPWVQFGGTSLSCPMWAGLVGIINQGRVAMGSPTLNTATDPTQVHNLLYSLPSSDFRDITLGTNGGYNAGTGYDFVTGRGTPIVNLLVPHMVVTSPPIQSLVVSTLSDAVGHSGLSLRDAISFANLDAAAGFDVGITFASGLSGTITLQQGALELRPGSSTVSINGGGAITVSGKNGSGVFKVDAGAHANLGWMTIRDGVESQGGGIWNMGTLSVSNCNVSNNTVSANINTSTTGLHPGAPYPTYNSAQGGGIYNGVTGILTVNNSSVTSNKASASASFSVGAAATLGAIFNMGQGGGIFNSGAMTVSNSFIYSNLVTGSATTTLNGLSGNGATFNMAEGGGIFNIGQSTTNNSTIAYNTATGSEVQNIYGGNVNGGGTFFVGYGGGFDNESGFAAITQCTVVGNTAAGSSKANFGFFATNVGAGRASFSYGKAGGIGAFGTTVLINSIVGGNVTNSSDPEIRGNIDPKSTTNLFGVTGTNYLLPSLGYYGGPTPGFALNQNTQDGAPLTTVVSDTGGPSIVVANAAAIASTPGAYPIWLGGEEMLVTNVNLATNTLTVVRGYNGTLKRVQDVGRKVWPYMDQRGYSYDVVNLDPSIGAYQFAGIAPDAASVTGISTASGPLNGGNLVTIKGTNLENTTSVNFGPFAGKIVSNTSNQIVVAAPKGSPGSFAVTVTTAAEPRPRLRSVTLLRPSTRGLTEQSMSSVRVETTAFLLTRQELLLVVSYRDM